MPVAPDLLLTSMTAPAPKAAATRAPADSGEAVRKEASSFSQVYAKERQAKPAERTDGANRQARDTRQEPARNDGNPAPAAEQPAAVADTGKALPAEGSESEDQDGSAEDPLLLLGLFEAQPLPAEALDPQVQGEVLVAASGNLVGAFPDATQDADGDAESVALDALSMGRVLTLDVTGQAKSGEPAGQVSAAAASTPGAGQVFASAMSAMGLSASTSATDTTESGDLPVLELTSEGLEALKESSADTPPEQFVSKLTALSQVIGQQASQVARVPVVPGQPVAMQQSGWSEGVVDKVMWMSSQNLKSAEIQLDPAELGRLDVRISLNQDQTQISFASAHPGVREALESQVHRLRDMFTQQGLNLSDVNVSDQSQGRAWQGQEGDGRGRGGRSVDDGASGSADEERVIGSVELREATPGSGRGMVDYYA